MFAQSSSHPVRNALAAAAMSVTAFLAAAGVSPSNAQTIAKSAPPAAGQIVAFTPAECRRIMATVADQVQRVGTNNLSPEFRQSWVGMIMQGGQRTCTGPRVIAWRTREDWATYQSIVSRLEASEDQIYLERAGVSLAPSPVASLSLR